MKTIKFISSLLAIAIVFFASCSNDDNSPIVSATQESFSALKKAALESKVQDFQFDASQTGYLTTENGVQLVINGNCLTSNGIPISGTADIQVVEQFTSGAMVITNKPTMGVMPNGDKALLISGGEFFVNATQGGTQLQLDCPIQVLVPTALTGGEDNNMTLWSGNGRDNDCDGIDDDCDGFIWEEQVANGEAIEAEIQEGDNGETFYVSNFGNFGWTNVDRFYNDPRPKTTLLVNVPNGYDNTNSAVYIYYNGEPNALGELDTYIKEQQLFSEHYGQIPIGLECHIVFASEDNGSWRYAIKPATITDGGIITITASDLNTATASELEALVNSLP